MKFVAEKCNRKQIDIESPPLDSSMKHPLDRSNKRDFGLSVESTDGFRIALFLLIPEVRSVFNVVVFFCFWCVSRSFFFTRSPFSCLS